MAEIVTLAEYKTYKAINSTTSDAQIRYIVTAVNSLVKNYCNRSFVDNYVTGEELTAFFNGNTESLVYLDELPLKAIDSVEISFDGGVTYETPLVEGTDYLVDQDTGTIQTVSGSPFTVGTRISHHSLKVVYTGGYAVAPADLKVASLDLVAYYFNEEYTPKKSMSRTGAGEVTQFLTHSLPPHIKRVMDLYRIIF